MLILSESDDFIKKDSILSIWGSSSRGLGWAIFREEGKLESVGFVSPFAVGAKESLNRDEVHTKMCRVWEEKKGYHCRPKTLCLDAAGESAFEKGFLMGMFRNHFKPRKFVCLTKEEREIQMQHFFDKKTILDAIGGCSRNVLKKYLAYISRILHPSIYKAVALGFFATPKYKKVEATLKEQQMLAA